MFGSLHGFTLVVWVCGPFGLAAAVVSGAAAFALAVLPQLQFGRNGVLLHVALEMAASLIALLAGFLVFGRLRRRKRE